MIVSHKFKVPLQHMSLERLHFIIWMQSDVKLPFIKGDLKSVAHIQDVFKCPHARVIKVKYYTPHTKNIQVVPLETLLKARDLSAHITYGE